MARISILKCFLFLLCLPPLGAAAQDLRQYFKGTEGCFALYDLKGDRYLRYNEERCRRRFSPFSTFKIPNSLIGLETGVIKDAEFVIPWDRVKYPPGNWTTEPYKHWGQDHSLRTAIKYSVVWYYRELASRVGAARMEQWLEKFGYGNRDASGGIDHFWLDSSLRISPDEQVEFLKAFYQGRLPVSKRSSDIVKEIITLEQTDSYKLSGKTGGGPLGERALGWFVGYLETKDNVYFFALNIEGANSLAIRDERINLTKRILTGLGYLPSRAQVATPKSADGAAPVYQAPLDLSDYNLLFTRVKINGQEARALIDSGSFRAVQLSSTLAQSLKLALTKTGKASRRYEGKEIYPTSGRIESLAIGDYERRDVEVDVIEGDVENIAAQVGTKFDVILGWGFISQFHILLDYKRLSMRFGERPLAVGAGATSLKYSVVNGAPIVRGLISPSNEEVGLLFDTGAPMCNLDLDLASAPKGAKVSREVTLAERRFTLEFRAKDLTAIRKPLGCVGVIGNNLLRQYSVYFDPDAKVIQLSSG